jgi:colicin import membrane protein
MNIALEEQQRAKDAELQAERALAEEKLCEMARSTEERLRKEQERQQAELKAQMDAKAQENKTLRAQLSAEITELAEQKSRIECELQARCESATWAQQQSVAALTAQQAKLGEELAAKELLQKEADDKVRASEAAVAAAAQAAKEGVLSSMEELMDSAVPSARSCSSTR